MALEKTWRWFGPNDSIKLSDLKQIGVEGVVTSLHHLPNGSVWDIAEIEQMKMLIEAAGIRWSVVESLPVAEGIKMGSPNCASLIENYKQSICNLGKCGIDTVCYNFMPVLDWARTDLHYRHPSGVESMYFDYTIFAAFDIYLLQRPDAENSYSKEVVDIAREIANGMPTEEQERLLHNIIVVTQHFVNSGVGDTPDYKKMFLKLLSQYDAVDSNKLRENLRNFLHQVVPVAEEAGVNLCIHPDDPPFQLLGLPRIASTIDDFKWIMDQYDSVANGITFCTGSLSAREDNDLVRFVEEIGPRIGFVHLRNTKLVSERSFYESGHLEGSVDMYEVVKALLKEQIKRKDEGRKDWRMPFRPDHGLKMLSDFSRNDNPGYPLVGRMKGLAEIIGLEMAIERSLM